MIEKHTVLRHGEEPLRIQHAFHTVSGDADCAAIWVEWYTKKVLAGGGLSRTQALELAACEDLEALCAGADEIRKAYCGDQFDLCSIVNGKSGKCSEDCKYCAQSCRYETGAEEYPLLSAEVLAKEAKHNDDQGIMRFSVVTSGRKLSDEEVDEMCAAYRQIRNSCGISLCASHGLLTYPQMVKLKEAGVTRYHNNLETSQHYFSSICSTHTYEDKLKTLEAARAAGLELCSGGIMGMGETMEDRIDMALQLRSLDVRSVPINILNPIPGTELESQARLSLEEVRRITAVYRFLLPQAALRMAGGRGLLPDSGKQIFSGGANAAITGDMLTTSGISVERDKKIVKELGFQLSKLQEEIPPVKQGAKGLFVAATGTEVGKTYITALIIKKLRESGAAAGYFKAAASDAQRRDGRLIADDAAYVKKIAGLEVPEEEMIPYVYEHSVSPHLAARIEGNPVELKKVKQAYAAACSKYQYLTIEGSGGIVCPIRTGDQQIMLTDFIREFQLPVLLVAPAGLGTINSTVLTAEYAASRGIRIRGIILNRFHPGDLMEEDNKTMVERMTGIPVVCCVEDGAGELEISGEALASLYE